MRAAVGALIPTPLVNWAVTSGKPGLGAADRIGELVTGGGGLATIAINSGVAVVAVGALATGAAVAPHSHADASRHARAHVASAIVVNGAGSDVALVSTADAGETIRVSAAGPSRSTGHASLASGAPPRAVGATQVRITGASGPGARHRNGSDGHGSSGSHGDGSGSGSGSVDGGRSSGSGSNSHGGGDHSGSGGGDHSGSSGGDKSGSSGSTSGDGGNGAGGSGGTDGHGGTGSDSHGIGSSAGGGSGDGSGSGSGTITTPLPTTLSSSHGE
jgi:hypothetical protein